ncbi:hypothetical protein CC2G_004031 [Coprinopsis cinerea AmutBmut pab1-1]|nr:hypothetical protein CC2G_004031 [Coprinopsis cinerea AmutBmut pab1-1]
MTPLQRLAKSIEQLAYDEEELDATSQEMQPLDDTLKILRCHMPKETREVAEKRVAELQSTLTETSLPGLPITLKPSTTETQATPGHTVNGVPGDFGCRRRTG